MFWFENQVRSECLTYTFRASCCSACLSRAQVLTFAGSSVPDRKKKRGGDGGGGGGGGGNACTGWYKGVQAGGGWFEVLWNVP